MSTTVVTRLALAGLLPLGVVSLAGASEAPTKAQVPFAFVVRGSVLPPGAYDVSSRRDMLILRGPEDTTCVLGSGLTSPDERRPKLVFHRRGQTYFLREVWTGGGLGHEIRPSREERQGIDMARSSTLPVEVLLNP